MTKGKSGMYHIARCVYVGNRGINSLNGTYIIYIWKNTTKVSLGVLKNLKFTSTCIFSYIVHQSIVETEPHAYFQMFVFMVSIQLCRFYEKNEQQMYPIMERSKKWVLMFPLQKLEFFKLTQ